MIKMNTHTYSYLYEVVEYHITSTMRLFHPLRPLHLMRLLTASIAVFKFNSCCCSSYCCYSSWDTF